MPIKLVCPKCSQIGSALREENTFPSPSGLEPKLTLVSGGFYHRVRKGLTGAPQVVCGNCEAVLPD